MKFLKKLLFVILKIIIVVVFTWLFLAVFWFNNVFNPADVWNNFFSAQALEYAKSNIAWTLFPPGPPQLISNLSVLGQIPELYSFVSTPIQGIPENISPIILGYLLPFAMGLVFGGICLGILVLLSRFTSRFILRRPSKKSKRKGRYDKYDPSKANQNVSRHMSRSERKEFERQRLEKPIYPPERGYGERGYYGNDPRNYPTNNRRYEPEPYGYPDRDGPPPPPPYGYQR